ncbi:MAG: tRNA (guanine-N7-)-methyltransferase [Verrucomicrobiota bacterium]|jgi:tRNA (guanine-N7-)-methyltransferase
MSLTPSSAIQSPIKGPSLIHRPESWVEPLRVAAMFPATQPLEVELGAGDGSFLAQWAAAHPERNFIGVERLLGRLRKLDRKGQRLGLQNLRLMRIEASYFLQYLLPASCVTALHVYFPDPWPKRKHQKNRLINEHFPVAAARALVSGGVVWLRTDHAEYFEQMQEVFRGAKEFRALETPPDLAAVVTDFERQFNAQGICTWRAGWVLGQR